MSGERQKYYTKPATLVTKLTATDGVVTWPGEVKHLSKQIPTSLPASVIQTLHPGIVAATTRTEQSQSVDGESVNDQLRGTLHLAMSLRDRFRKRDGQYPRTSANNFMFRNLLQEIVGHLMPGYSIQEQIEYAVPRGQSPKLNFLPGISASSRKVPFIVLYDVKAFEEHVDSQFGNSSNGTGIGSSNLNQLEREELSKHSCQSSDVEKVESASDASTSDSPQAKQLDYDQDQHPSTLDIRSWQAAKEAYLLTETRVGKAPSVAFLCGGSIDEVDSLMLSAVYHRSVWGVTEPLIGFCWNSAGTIITTVFGWMDTKVDQDGRLPDVHIAYAEEGVSNGVFDMRESDSVLRLVLFIWNIREVLYRITCDLESAVPHVTHAIKEHGLMQWRADTTPSSLNKERVTQSELFSLWLDDDHIGAMEDNALSFCHMDSISHRERDESLTSASDRNESEGGSWAEDWVPTRSYFQTEDRWFVTPMEERWLQDRRAYSMCPFDDVQEATGIRMFELFERYTQFYRPPTSANGTVDLSFFSSDIKRTCDDISDERFLQDDVWEHLIPHIGMLSSLCASARRKMDYKNRSQLIQAETRTEWESILDLLFQASSGCDYDLRTDCAKQVNLPRSIASDLLPSIFSDWGTSTSSFMEYSLCLQAHRLDWFNYWAKLIKSDSPMECITPAGQRVDILGNRVLLFMNDSNKRHLWRSLKRDHTTGRATSMGVITVGTCQGNASPLIPSADLFLGNDDVSANSLCLALPLLLYGYPERSSAHPREIPQTSMNHTRMNLVACTTYLASLGVVEFPLFGLAIEGSIGTVICAWCGPIKVQEKMQACIRILDQETIQYDLATPIGAYNYATFVSLLAKRHAPELAERLMRAQEGESELLKKDWSKHEWIRNDWTMAEQVAWFKGNGYFDYIEYCDS